MAYRVLSTRAIVWFAMGLVAVGVGMATWLMLAYGGGTDSGKARLEAIKTAGTIVVGTGGAAALWLAARRQQSAEIALRQKETDQAHQERVAIQSEHDAVQRRITELYAKAVEQLGSEKAPVRLGGMYALERLAQNEVNQRQTIANILCAYLRMPYPYPKTLESAHAGHAVPLEKAEEDPLLSEQAELAPFGERESREQERQVRLTAQRILVAHLNPGVDPKNPVDTFWESIDIDLTGATLLDFDLSHCCIRTARFDGSVFCGDAVFSGSVFGGDATFSGSVFGGDALFGGTEFGGIAVFARAKFCADSLFGGAGFVGSARFGKADFSRDALFGRAEFKGDARFSGAEFHGNARFGRVKFQQNARFGNVQFCRDAWFSEAIFKLDARFGKAEFSGDAVFAEAKFCGDVVFSAARFKRDAAFNETEFGGYAWFSGAEFAGATRFGGARVRLDLSAGVRPGLSVDDEPVWPDGMGAVEIPFENGARLSDQGGSWGYLTAITSGKS